MKKGVLWILGQGDKVDVSRTRCCPPHYLPHKFPMGKKIADEPCHIHKSKVHMAHHSWFCRYLKCPNYPFMRKKYEEWKKQ